MKIVVVGAGAVGAWYGGLLSLAGNEVHLVTRSDYTTIRNQGLKLRDAHGIRTVNVTSAQPDTQSQGPADLVIIAAKATANAELPALIRPLIKSTTILLTLQNGMGNVENLAGLVPDDQLVAGLCFVCINRTSPGVIENTMPGYIRMASVLDTITPATTTCVDAFTTAEVQCRAEASLESVLWKKLCWNIPFNGLAIAGGGITTDVIMANPALKTRARQLMLEVQTAAAARGYPFSDQHLEQQFTVTETMGPYRPSSLIDYLAGRSVEVSGLWAEPLKRGEVAGVQMPELRKLLSEIENKLRQRPTA
jgi:2-dehydropantoate 2-reductase